MFNFFKRGGRLMLVLVMAGVALIGLASPASASTGRHNTSTGIVGAGVLTFGPFSASNFPDGPQSNSTLSASVAGLLSSGAINTKAGPTTASASVVGLSVTLSPLATLAATAVSSKCSYDSTTMTLTGSSSIAGGTITVAGLPTIQLATSPAKNTQIKVKAPITGATIASVVLNRQTTNPDGSLTVDAIFVTLLNGQTIAVASSTCQAAVLAIPVIAPAFALGTGAVAVVGLPVLGFFLYRRRQTSAAIARA